MKRILIGTLLIITIILTLLGYIAFTRLNVIDQVSLNNQPVYAVPETSACATTQPPPSMEGINNHPEAYGTGADPDIITLGPKIGGCEGCTPYHYKTSMEFELPRGTPVLAPIDMVLIGVNNRNAEYRVRDNGEVQTPYDDLELTFRSESLDWPGMIICTYHLQSSPLMLGQGLGVGCDREEEWTGTFQVLGHQFYETNEIVYKEHGGVDACEALIGRLVKRGEVIGYAGNVGNHSMAPFRFKVSHTTENPTVKIGNKHLHWVQPGSFFYWKYYNPDADYPPGVLAYPFPCDGYTLPPEQYDVNFKYKRDS